MKNLKSDEGEKVSAEKNEDLTNQKVEENQPPPDLGVFVNDQLKIHEHLG